MLLMLSQECLNSRNVTVVAHGLDMSVCRRCLTIFLEELSLQCNFYYQTFSFHCPLICSGTKLFSYDCLWLIPCLWRVSVTVYSTTFRSSGPPYDCGSPHITFFLGLTWL
ncbi:hypothetical protein GOODEAATRI_010950 [Goodea atripinnis]|uniref:Uncharacterized protein n=1 Tax=Goodea atripinnis TaxID=208336 RepID=A0ABV0N9M4_9TELE